MWHDECQGPVVQAAPAPVGAEDVATYQGPAYCFCSSGYRTSFLGGQGEDVSAENV